MPRQSTVRQLPPDIRDAIGRLLDEGRTLDEIRAALAALGADISRSALGRYKQHMDKVAERIRRSRDMAETLVRATKDAPESKTARLNIELLHSALLDLVSGVEARDGEDSAPVGLDPMGAMLLAKALDHLGKASKADQELRVKIREEAMAEARRDAAKAVETVAKEQGLTEEQVGFLRARILGVKVDREQG